MYQFLVVQLFRLNNLGCQVSKHFAEGVKKIFDSGVKTKFVSYLIWQSRSVGVILQNCCNSSSSAVLDIAIFRFRLI